MENKTYKLKFREIGNAAVFLANIASKIERTGYFSIKDCFILYRTEHKHFTMAWPEVLNEWEEAELIGWRDIRNAELHVVEPIDRPEGTICILTLPEPEYIGDKVSIYISKYIDDHAEQLIAKNLGESKQ